MDKIKIDRSFVPRLGQLAEAIAIAQAMISMEHALGVTIAAEGVETPKLAEFLAVAGVDEMQGTSLRGPAADTIDAIAAAATSAVRIVAERQATA